jgi:hypothetical protein
MTEFVSEDKTILYRDADVYRVLSDLRNLGSVSDQLPENRLSDFSFDENRVSFRLDPIGEVTFFVEEREPNKMVKFKSEKLPFDVFLWIQLVAKAEKDTRLRLIVHADLNPILSGIAQKPMREMMDKISDALSQLPYDRL